MSDESEMFTSTEWVPHPKLADYTDLIFNPQLDAGIELSRQIDNLLHELDAAKGNPQAQRDAAQPALALAIQFHDTYERLAPSFGYETRPDTKVFDPESKNGRLMVAVCAAIFGAPPPAEREPLTWVYEDLLSSDYPYDEMFKHSAIRDGVRMFPVYAP